MSALNHPLQHISGIMTDALEGHEALSALEAEQSPISALLMTLMA